MLGRGPGSAARLKAACAGPHEKMVRYGDHIPDMGLRAFFVNGHDALAFSLIFSCQSTMIEKSRSIGSDQELMSSR